MRPPLARLLVRGVPLALIAGLVSAAPPTAAADRDRPPVVRTDTGSVQGVRGDGVDSFRDIPFAAPPVGALRWQPPQPAATWTGVRPAETFGSACAQSASEFTPASVAEDCLFLNVQTPSTTQSRAKLPVYVFLHGGGLVQGNGAQFDGAALVKAAGAVYVSLNYRLGALGFLAHPALSAASATGESGNYGLLDQQAALKWVQRNISAFGGDPTRVTLGGQSAGAWSVCAHLVAPGSRGLFSQALMQSGSCPARPREDAETGGGSGVTVADQLGCSAQPDVVACLRAAPVADLVSADLWATFTAGTPTLPADPRAEIAAGRFATVPVLTGANRDEARSFAVGGYADFPTRESYQALAAEWFGSNADAILARYPWPTDPAKVDRFTTNYLMSAIFTDAGVVEQMGGCPQRALATDLARFTRTYVYEFAHRTGPGQQPDSSGFVFGAGHGAELAYLFPQFFDGRIAATFGKGERYLASTMRDYWGDFLNGRTPKVDRQPRWPTFDTTGQVLSLRSGGATRAVSDARIGRQHQCGFWETLGGSPFPDESAAATAQRTLDLPFG